MPYEDSDMDAFAERLRARRLRKDIERFSLFDAKETSPRSKAHPQSPRQPNNLECGKWTNPFAPSKPANPFTPAPTADDRCETVAYCAVSSDYPETDPDQYSLRDREWIVFTQRLYPVAFAQHPALLLLPSAPDSLP